MVGKKPKRRRLDRVDWEMLVRQYEAGSSIPDISTETGLSESWVYAKVRRHAVEPKEDRRRHHLEALRRELMRAEALLITGGVDAAVKRMRALNMLMKIENEFSQASNAAPDLAVEAEDFAHAKAELERRLDRLRTASAGKSLSELGYTEPGSGLAL